MERNVVILEVHDDFTIVKAGVYANRLIKDMLSARPDNFQFMQKYKQGHWDGKITLYKDMKFPAGLTPYIAGELQTYDLDVTINDHSFPHECFELVLDLANGDSLRPYQEDSVDIATLNRRGVLHLATNAGKTYIAASLILSTGCRAVYVVPNRKLLNQTSDDLRSMLGNEVGMYGDGKRDFQDVTVTTIASFKKLIAENKDSLESNILLLIDECHHVKAETLWKHTFQVPGPYRIGMSGTPLNHKRLDDLKLEGATGPIIHTITNQDLIQAGWSVPPEIRFIEIDNEYYEGDYQDVYRIAVVQNHYRNQTIADIVMDHAEKGDSILILANWIEHCELISQWIEAMPVLVATGKDSRGVLDEKIRLFGEPEHNVLIATNVFGEGVNIPNISVLVIAAAGKSHIGLLQKIGRGLRTHDSKEALIVYDFLDDTSAITLKHSDKRYALYRNEGFTTKLTEV